MNLIESCKITALNFELERLQQLKRQKCSSDNDNNDGVDMKDVYDGKKFVIQLKLTELVPQQNSLQIDCPYGVSPQEVFIGVLSDNQKYKTIFVKLKDDFKIQHVMIKLTNNNNYNDVWCLLGEFVTPNINKYLWLREKYLLEKAHLTVLAYMTIFDMIKLLKTCPNPNISLSAAKYNVSTPQDFVDIVNFEENKEMFDFIPFLRSSSLASIHHDKVYRLKNNIQLVPYCDDDDDEGNFYNPGENDIDIHNNKKHERVKGQNNQDEQSHKLGNIDINEYVPYCDNDKENFYNDEIDLDNNKKYKRVDDGDNIFKMKTEQNNQDEQRYIDKIDIKSLNKNGLVTNTIIDEVLKALLKKYKKTLIIKTYKCAYYNVLFCSPNENKSFIHNVINELKSDFKYVIMPVNYNNNHWILFIIYLKTVKIYMLDSLNVESKGYDVVINNIEHLFKLKNENFNGKTEILRNLPKQQNSYDCGVFLLKYAKYFIKFENVNIDFETDTTSINNYREKFKQLILLD